MLDDPPGRDVIEISIFGPGRGESIVVHLGDSRWIIVDSCRTSSHIPVLSYLQRIGVDAAGDVKLVVATHPHTDHFAGIAEIFRTCTSAKFVCAPAMMSAEFIALTDLQAEDHAGVPGRAYKEYRQVFELIESRETTDEDVLEFAFPQKHLFSDVGPHVSCDVMSLSPSNRSFRRAMRYLRKAIPLADTPSTPAPVDANDFAVALWIEAGGKHILLGSDLPKGTTGFGWQAVLAGPRPRNRASIYKVSHHGSVTGHRPGIWSELLVKEPLALLTPYRAGTKTVPSSSERQRILQLTNEAYITASPIYPSGSGPSQRIMASIGSLARNVQFVDSVGQVRARSSINETKWHVEVLAPAEKLKA